MFKIRDGKFSNNRKTFKRVADRSFASLVILHKPSIAI